MKTTLLAAAVLSGIAGTSFGQAVTTALTSESVVATPVSSAAVTAHEQGGEATSTRTPAPGGTGILIRAVLHWTATGFNAQLGNGSRPGPGASTQPALGRGLAFGASGGRERP